MQLDPHDIADAVNALVNDNMEYIEANQELTSKVEQLETQLTKFQFSAEEYKIKFERADNDKALAETKLKLASKLADCLERDKQALESALKEYNKTCNELHDELSALKQRLGEATHKIARGKITISTLMELYGPNAKQMKLKATKALSRQSARRPSSKLVSKNLRAKRGIVHLKQEAQQITPPHSQDPVLSQSPFHQVINID